MGFGREQVMFGSAHLSGPGLWPSALGPSLLPAAALQTNPSALLAPQAPSEQPAPPSGLSSQEHQSLRNTEQSGCAPLTAQCDAEGAHLTESQGGGVLLAEERTGGQLAVRGQHTPVRAVRRRVMNRPHRRLTETNKHQPCLQAPAGETPSQPN